MAAKIVARTTDIADPALDDELLEKDGAPSGPSGWAAAWPKIKDLAGRNPKVTAALLFMAGLCIGWVRFGWLLFPIRWTDTDPWDMRLEHQMRYVQLVAFDYWESGDMSRVNEALDGWEAEDLADVLRLVMSSDKVSAEARQQVAALAEALQTPTYDQSLWASLLSNQKAILFGFLIAALPLMLAAALVIVPMLRQAGSSKSEAELLDEAVEGVDAENDLERLIGDVDLEEEEAEEEEEEEEDKILSEEESQEMASEITNMLSGLFDDDSQNTEQISALAKGLGDVDINGLHKRATLISGLLASALLLRDQRN